MVGSGWFVAPAGARLTVRGMLRSRGAALAVALTLAVVAFVLGDTMLTSGPATWWPLGGNPTGDYSLPDGPLGWLLEQLLSAG